MSHSKMLSLVCALEASGELEERRPRRKYWVHPYIKERSQSFVQFYEHIRKFDSEFFGYYRMSIKSFDELLRLVRNNITKKETLMRKPISAEERLTITLRYLSTGMTFASLHYEFYVGRSTISTIIKDCCQAIWNVLNEMEMPKPTTEMWINIAEEFFKKTNFPNCVGAVDGKHIRCINPIGGGSNFFNYKKFYSIVLMAVADANLNFVAIDVGALGKNGDSSIFKDSPLGQKLYSNTLNLPAPRDLPGTELNPQPFVLVGDEAFKISTNLLCPYPARGLTPKKRVYNYRHCRCRRTVECAFGVLANKWRIFHTPILVEPEFIDDIVKCCCVLHNFVRRRDGVNFEDTETHTFDEIINCGPGPRGKGLEVRDAFADFFIGAGAVSFQSKYMF